jgi:TnpA family transposase
MTAIHETAYPRTRSNPTDRELNELFTPTPADIAFARRHTKSAVSRLGLLVLLKTFQRLGYFPNWAAIPPRIVQHIATVTEFTDLADGLQQYEQGQFRWQHLGLIRDYLGVKAFSAGGQRVMIAAMLEAAHSKDIIADLINVGIEALVQARFELPAFSALLRAAGKARARVNRRYYEQVYNALDERQKTLITHLLTRAEDETKSPWHRLKQEPRQPTPKHMREFIQHLRWLQSLNGAYHVLDTVPETKLQRFVDEARALNVNRMNEMQPTKRLTLAIALIRARTAQALDDLGEMFIRRISKLHQRADEALQNYRLGHQAQTDELIALLANLLDGWRQAETWDERLRRLNALIGDNADALCERCEVYLSYAGNNYLPFLPRLYKSQRGLYVEALALLQPTSTSTDKALEHAIAFLLQQRMARAQRLSVMCKVSGAVESRLDLSWVPQRWWKAVTGLNRRDVIVETVDRRYFELCVLSCVMLELKSGDLFIAGAERFGDYRAQLISWEDYEQHVASYCEQVGISADPTQFIEHLKTWLGDAIHTLDVAFPDNAAVTIKDGEPIIHRLEKQAEPENFGLINRLLSERLPERNLLDMLADTEHWLNWTRRFGPLSGFEARIDSPRERYVTNTFCYGRYLGPSQTARAMKDIDRRHVAYINQYHVTEQNLLDVNVEVINAYNRFKLPKLWGSGKSAAADGTKWDVYEQNLLSEYHIRYGGWGGIGYYHVSDTYIALFSSFVACGVWEAVHILDGLLENRSEIRPDTLHADTQGQSESVFGLAYLLAIQLMPRIRNWKDLTLYLPHKAFAVEHIGELFSDTIDWQLIKTHLPDMLRVALSISHGKIRSSTILRRLGTYGRKKNKVYLAFRELGRVVRTVFLLNFVSDPELRRTITAATNTSEAWNAFIQWVAFGGDGIIRENSRDEQRKIIRYNHLVANLLVFHNAVSMTRALQELIDEGHPVTEEIIARLAPYRTDHINRFGSYELKFDQVPEPIAEDLQL